MRPPAPRRRSAPAWREGVLLAAGAGALLASPAVHRATAQDVPQAAATWETLTPIKVTSAAGATLVVEPDGAVVLQGAAPDKETITLECIAERKGVTGFRLEALADPRLPAQGPGCAANGNFVLSEFRVLAAPRNSDGFKPLVFERVSAGFEQTGFPLVSVLDGLPASGWAIAPQVGVSHEAIFEAQRDVGWDAGSKLRVTLEFQFGWQHQIGRFRLSCTTSPRPLRAARDLSALVEAQGRIPTAIARGVNWLLEQQELDGSWSYAQPENHHGMTALACYTLLKCGVKRGHPAVLRALDFMATRPPTGTYEAGIELMARAALEDGQELPRIQDITDRLLSWQVGGFSYPSGAADLSNTQYGAMGLRAAAHAGAKIPPDAWLKLGDEVLTHQEKGAGGYEPAGFGYAAGGPAYGSITAGGVCVMQICHEQLERIGMSRAAFPASVKRGLSWLDRNFGPTINPRGDANWIWYWLYGVERVGALCDVTEFGGRNWYREGAAHVVSQQKPEGSWDGGGGPQPSTCFALLFLARATSSVSGVSHRPENLYGGDDPAQDVSLRASGDTPLTAWVSSFGERVRTELAWPEDGGRGPRVTRVDYVLPSRALLPDARSSPGSWRYSLEPPTGGWELPDFDDRRWRSAPGAFGARDAAGASVRTAWSGELLFLRREFTLDGAPLVAPTLMVRFAGESASLATAEFGAPIVRLFDEEPGFAALVNESAAGGTIRVHEGDAFSGRYCLAVTPQQAFRAAMPLWGFAIAEKPRPGEYRYLRFAWRKDGGGGIMLQIAQDGAWNDKTRRFLAGSNEVGWAAVSVAREVPRRWTVVTVDLWKEFGANGNVTGIAFTPMSPSTGWYDAIYLARGLTELKAGFKGEVADAAPADLASGPAAELASPRVVATGEGPALDLFLNGTRLFSSSDLFPDYAAVTTQAALEQLLRPGRNVLALQARRPGPRPALDVAIVDERVLESVAGIPDAASGPERFAARLSFEKNGVYELRARVHVRPPPVDESDGEPEVVLESAPLFVPIREALDPELLGYARDPARNLIAQAGATATATSMFDANWAPARAIDNFAGRGWLSSDRDRIPSLTIELSKPVRADTVLLTPIQMRGADPDRGKFRVRRVEVQVDQGRGGTFEVVLPEEWRKGVLRLPRAAVVRRLDVKLVDATGVHPGKPALGLGEVELQLNR